MLKIFFYPYFMLIYGASWNVQQCLEGMGVRSSSFIEYDDGGHVISSYLSPAQALLPVLGTLSILTFALCVSIVVAGYVLRRKTGAVLAVFLLCLPGMLSLMSLWPVMPLVPDVYVISGRGILGSGWGIAPLLGIGVAAGWSGLLLLSDLLRLGEKFGYIYDHVWCLSGIIAAIFFVTDSQVGEHARKLQESVRTVQQASIYLSKQAVAYEQWCSANKTPNSAACRWAANIQQKLLDYSTEGGELYREFGPHSSAEVYSAYGRNIEPAEVLAIRTEIQAYNATICPVSELGPGVRKLTRSAHCLMTPAEYCFAYPDTLDGKINMQQIGETAALSSECIVPTLVALRARQAKLLTKVNEDVRARYYRWIYYLLFSVVAGGKIATSTIKLADMHRRTTLESRRSLYLVKQLWLLALLIFRYCFSAMERCVAWSWGQLERARACFGRRIHRKLKASKSAES